MVCIDEKGLEQFSLPDVNIDEVSNFYNNIALIDSRYIIDKKGKIIHDLKKEFDVEIIMLPDSYFDGFIFVSKKVNDIYMTGIMDSNLEWLIEPTSKLGSFEVKGNYLYYFYSLEYYDALSNEFINEDGFQQRHVHRSFPDSGLIFLEQKYDGMFSYECENIEEKGEIGLSDLCKTGFYNESLEMVLDLSNYKSVKPVSDFLDGKCLIEFNDEQNEHYTGLINMNGEFVFLCEGYIRDYDEEKIEMSDCYFDWDGKCYFK